MNLLITGGCGFIGSNFINYYFRQHKCIIVNIDAMYYSACISNIDIEIRTHADYTFYNANITSANVISYILSKHKITHVIHFAAQSHVQNSFTDSLQYTNDNVLGTHTLLEECRKYGGIKKFIHVSTDEVYGESDTGDTECMKTEESIFSPTNPYAATKAAAELIVLSYYKSFGLPIIITRGNNVYGPHQYPEKLIPLFINLLKSDKPVTIQGDGSHIRSFIHVDDVSKAFEIIIEKGEIGNIYNIGCHNEYSVTEIAKILINMIKGTNANWLDWVKYIPDRPFNDKRYYISNEKLLKLGWKGDTVDFYTGLRQLIN